VKTFDVDFQYRFRLSERQKLTCGANFRNVESYYSGGDQYTTWFPNPYPYFTTNYSGEFIQDEIAIIGDVVTLTLGTKLEQNPYTGAEYEPSARLLWAPDPKHSTWASISRAVRTPSRVDEQFNGTFSAFAMDVYPRVNGNVNIISEDMFAYEIGYREQVTDAFSFDIATFYNEYEHLEGAVYGSPYPEPTPSPYHYIVPIVLTNGPSGDTYGVELSVNYSVTDKWRLTGEYTYLHMYIEPSTVVAPSGFDPSNQLYFRSAWDIRENWEFDVMARYVDKLEILNVPSYITMDMRLAWRPRKHLELAVVGQNLLQAYHWEFAGSSLFSPTYATEVPRGVYGTVTWRY
jgi:iron complex outermembrane receptor protein